MDVLPQHYVDWLHRYNQSNVVLIFDHPVHGIRTAYHGRLSWQEHEAAIENASLSPNKVLLPKLLTRILGVLEGNMVRCPTLFISSPSDLKAF